MADCRDSRSDRYILPRAETGARAREVPLGYASTVTPTPALVLQDDTGVYITTNLKLAVYYAAGHKSGKGVVYEVEPAGEVTPDADYPGRTDVFRCARARIKAVAKCRSESPNLCATEFNGSGFATWTPLFLSCMSTTSAANMINIADEVEKHVAEFAMLGFPPHAIAVALTAAATELMLKCSKREAWEKATAAWAGVIEGMNKRAAQPGASSAACVC